VLKIDLLPRHFAIARTNKRILVIGLVLLVVVGAFFVYKHNGVQAQIAQTKEAIAKVEPIAAEVDKLQGEISEKESLLAPIKAKIDFVENADHTGDKYFDCFHDISKYIWEEAQMSSFSISGGSSVQFTVQVQGASGVGRFLLNLLRCPDLTGIGYSGMPSGRGIAATGAGGATAAASAPPGLGVPGRAGPGGAPPGMGMMGAAGLGRPGAAASSGAVGGEPGSLNEPVTLQISATLTKPITTPTPPGGGAAAGGMGMGMPMAPPGMMGGGGMPPPGMGGPGVAPGAAGGAGNAGGLSEENE